MPKDDTEPRKAWTRPTPQKMVTLAPKYWEWIEKRGMRSAVIRAALDLAMKAEGGKNA